MIYLDQKHNSYILHCPLTEQKMFRSSCVSRLAKIKTSQPYSDEKWPECAKAFGRSCPAQDMAEEELIGTKRYYIDRDDAGTGIASRKRFGLSPRTKDEIKQHHMILKLIDVKPIDKAAVE